MAENDTTAMAEPTIRFKRRKTTHARRVYQQADTPTLHPTSSEVPTDTVTASLDHTIAPPLGESADTVDDEDTVPNLKDILRNRKRPRDRLREVARKAESKKSQALVPTDAPKQDVYGNRFVAQTGQVVDVDDQQM